MANQQDALLVCKHCGAIRTKGGTHCALCGAVLRQDMLLTMRRPLMDHEAERIQNRSPIRDADAVPSTAAERTDGKNRKKASVKALLALLFGIAAVIGTAFSASLLAVPCGAAAMTLGIIALAKKEGCGLASAIGIGLGAYTLLVSGFWTFFSFYYMF